MSKNRHEKMAKRMTEVCISKKQFVTLQPYFTRIVPTCILAQHDGLC